MVERPHQVIQKTISRRALIGLAAATMMITVSIMSAITQQEASAAKPQFCFAEGPGLSCRNTMQECRADQANSPLAMGPCRPLPYYSR